MPGIRFSPALACGSMPMRSGRIIAFTVAARVGRALLRAQRAVADLERAAAPSPLGSPPLSRFETPRKSATKTRLAAPRRSPAARRLLDAAAVHHRDPVAHRERLLLVVRDEHERDPELGLERLQLDLQVLAQLRVERAERLVEQQHARPQHERPRERDALLLAARELAGLARARSRVELTSSSASPTRFAPLLLRQLVVLEAEGDVVGHVEVREQRVALEHGVDVALVRRALRATSSPSSRIRPLVGRSKPAIMRSVVVFPQPDGPSMREELARRHVEVDAVDGDDVVELLAQLLEPDLALSIRPPVQRCDASASSPPANRR